MPLLSRHGRLPIALAATGTMLALPVTELRAESVPVQDRHHVADSLSPAPSQSIDRLIAEAAQRFGIPRRWIAAIIAAESGGDPRALSPKGAMGLMQLMPATWADLTRRHRLGADPFEPRANVLAGTAYLRALHYRFGFPGALAAYNAGPGRYAEHIATGRPLPRETRVYVARVLRRLGDPAAAAMQAGNPSAVPDWRAAPLFAARGGLGRGTATVTAPSPDGTPAGRRTGAAGAAANTETAPHEPLFVTPQTGVRP